MKTVIAISILGAIAVVAYLLLKKKPETPYQKIETGQPEVADYSDYSGYFNPTKK